MYVMGISAMYHDSACAIICDGEIVAAAQEERFTRKKHDNSFPVNAALFCLDYAGITMDEVQAVIYYENPGLVLGRYLKNLTWKGSDYEILLNEYLDRYSTSNIWIHKQARLHLGGLGKEGKLFATKHHMSHAASAFYPSPFEKAVIITMDGVGEWATATIGVGEANSIKIKKEMNYPNSLGMLYSAFTYFCGFKVNSGDYKFMGLAPYGEPIYEDIIKANIIDIREDGSFSLNMDYFDYWRSGTMINDEKFGELFAGERRKPEARITKREMDIAASVQKIVENIIIRMAAYAKREYGQDTDNLVLAGGVALNCVANGRLKRKGIFKNIWIQPAAGDAGGALGAALYMYYKYYGNERMVNPEDSQKGSYLGPEYSKDEILQFLRGNGCEYHLYGDRSELTEIIADKLSDGNVIGLFQGRMEFGPRALGGRSIIADARSEDMQILLNQKIKFRESFRPFAPSVLLEDVSTYFEIDGESPYMLLVDDVRKERQIGFELSEELAGASYDMLHIVKQKRSDIPAITHVDYSARIQTLTKERNGWYYEIVKAFQKKTGCGVIVNTSFNVRGEPIVCSPEDAYRCFMRTEMDMLVIENFILYKSEQRALENDSDWRKEFELD